MFGLSFVSIGLYAALTVAVVGGGVALVKQHDAAVRAEVAAAEASERLVTERADAARTVSALEQRAATAELQAASQTKIRKAIANAPASTACINSVAVRAALDGLRQPNSGH